MDLYLSLCFEVTMFACLLPVRNKSCMSVKQRNANQFKLLFLKFIHDSIPRSVYYALSLYPQKYVIKSISIRKKHHPPHLANDLLNRGNLAASTARHVLALAASISTLNTNTAPVPARASARSTQNIHISRAARNGTLDVVQSEAGNGDTVGGGTSRAAILVILLNDDAVLGDAGKSDVLVGDALDAAGLAVDGLDANAVLRVADAAVFDVDGVDGVV